MDRNFHFYNGPLQYNCRHMVVPPAKCTAIFMYADDVMLLAPSVCALQSLVDVCASELEFLDMAINVKKIGLYASWPEIQTCAVRLLYLVIL